MTTTCDQKHGKNPRLRSFLYNPYALRIRAADADAAWAWLSDAVAAHLAHRRIALVKESGAAGALPAGAGISLLESNGLRVLTYAADTDAYGPPWPLVDADWAIAVFAEPGIDGLVLETDGLCDEVRTLPADVSTGEGARIIEELMAREASALPLRGLVLVGGRSTRMGEDKAGLAYHGAPQAQRAYELLAPHCSETYISCRPDQAGDPLLSQWPQIHDKIQGAGPLGGIVSALKHDPNAAWLVLACDLPYCGEETVAGLVQGRNPYKLATAYRSGYDGFPEPLCAIYEPKSLLRLLHFYGVGYHCPRKALINSDTRILEPVRPEALANVNTPEDREQAERRLAGSSGERRPNDGQS